MRSAFGPIQTQTVAVAVYSRSSPGHLGNPGPNDRVVPQLVKGDGELETREINVGQCCFSGAYLQYSLQMKDLK